MPDPTVYPPELHAEFAALVARTGALVASAQAGTPDRDGLIDLLHRLGGAGGLFGRGELGAAAKALGEAIEASAVPLPASAYAPLAALIAAS